MSWKLIQPIFNTRLSEHTNSSSGQAWGSGLTRSPVQTQFTYVSLWLVAFCWIKSLLCNDAYYTGMLFYSESTFQLWASRRLCVEFKTVSSVSLHPSGRRGIPFGCSSVKHHPSKRQELSFRTFLCVQKLQLFLVASVRTSQQHVRTPFSVQQAKRFLSKTQILQPSGRFSVPVRMLFLIRQVMQKTFNRPNVRLHGSDAQALIWKLRAAEVQPSER
jgi:hypothetical protein